MSQDFNKKFEKMLGNDPSVQDGISSEENEKYSSPGYSRYVCFILENGTQESFYYNNLTGCKYMLDESEIHLEFTTGRVVLKGFKLAEMHFEILNHQLRIIKVSDSRYNSLADNRAILNSIEIFKE